MTLAIKNALICDGTLAQPYTADILLENNKIVSIGKITDNIANTTIDAKDRIVAPGFVDTHRHFDFAVLSDETFGKLELAQGITTGVSGNCGLAPYPCTLQIKEELYDFISPCLGRYDDERIFNTMKEYLSCVEKKNPGINVGFLAATGAIKIAVKGFSKTPFTAHEMDKAQSLLCDSLEDGAVGISCGIMYPPECYSSKEEFIKLLKPTKKYNKILTSHIRGEGDSLYNSVKEIIEIAQKTDLRVNISHLKATGMHNWKKEIFNVIQLIENEKANGVQVSADVYPYIGGSTILTSLLPPDFICDTIQQTLHKLETKEGIDKLRQAITKKYAAWDNMVESVGWERIIINGVELEKNYKYQGKNILEICNTYDFSDPIEFIAELLVEEKGRVSIIVMSMCQEDLDTIIALDYTAVISDALYGKTNYPHPRLYSAFPKVLREYVYEKKILSLQKAINKMTYMPAQRFSLHNKGIIKVGADADLVIFDIANIKDNANFANSNLLATGLDMVIIGGHIVMENNVLLANKGKLIK